MLVGDESVDYLDVDAYRELPTPHRVRWRTGINRTAIAHGSNTYAPPDTSGDGLLRHPSFRGIRTDKTPEEVDLPS